MRKKAQEEMVGFGMIIAIVMIIMVIFLWFYLNKSNNEEIIDYGAKSFVDSFLDYTSSCKEYGRDYLVVKELIYWCYSGSSCEEGDACEILQETMDGILGQSWKVGEEEKIKGYSLNITSENGDFIYSKQEGNLISANSKGYYWEYPKKRIMMQVDFSIYY